MPLLNKDYQQFGQGIKHQISQISTQVAQLNSAVMSYSTQVNQGTITEDFDAKQRMDIQVRLKKIGGDLKKSSASIQTLRDIPLQSATENQTRQQEHGQLSRRQMELAQKYRDLGDKFSKAMQTQERRQRVRPNAGAVAIEEEEKNALSTPREELKQRELRLAQSLQ